MEMSKILSGQVSRMYGKIKFLQSNIGYEFNIQRTPVSYMYNVNRYNYYIECTDYKDKDISLRILFNLMINSYLTDGFMLEKQTNNLVILVKNNYKVEMDIMESPSPYNRILWSCFLN